MFMAGLLLTLLLLLLGCSPGHIAAGNGAPIYKWVGCYVIEQAPVDNVHVIHPGGDLTSGQFFFKQASLDLSVAPVTTGRPCREGD